MTPTRPSPQGQLRRALRLIALRVDPDERGAVAGLEGLLFAVLILLGGLVLIVNAWSVIDTRTALDSASREFIRSYTAQDSAESARDAGSRAARSVLVQRGNPSPNIDIRTELPNGFGPCAAISVSVSVQLKLMAVPFQRAFPPMTVSSRAQGLVDAHRQLSPNSAYSAQRTTCFGE